MITEAASRYKPEVQSSTDLAHIRAELLAITPAENRKMVSKTLAFAIKYHKGQYRKYEGTIDKPAPFVIHPIRTAYSLAKQGFTDLEYLIPAILHDVVEDNSNVTLAEIARKFGEETSQDVDSLSKIVQGNYKNVFDYYRVLGLGPERRRRIKVEDRIDNLYALTRQQKADYDDNTRADKIIETIEYVLPLASFDPKLKRRLNDAIIAVKGSISEEFTAELKQQLEAAGIDTSTWGKGLARSVLDLKLEILAKEARLTYDENGNLQREIDLVNIDVRHITKEGIEQRLVEARQEFKDGSKPTTRDITFSFSKKILRGKSVSTGVKKAFMEYLSIFDIENSQIIPKKRFLYEGQYVWYPGIKNRSVTNVRQVYLTEGQFRPADEYVQEQPDKTIYYRWVDAVEPQHSQSTV